MRCFVKKREKRPHRLPQIENLLRFGRDVLHSIFAASAKRACRTGVLPTTCARQARLDHAYMTLSGVFANYVYNSLLSAPVLLSDDDDA